MSCNSSKEYCCISISNNSNINIIVYTYMQWNNLLCREISYLLLMFVNSCNIDIIISILLVRVIKNSVFQYF